MLAIYLGPPKTATTSLQEAFKKSTSAQVVFWGIQQPRLSLSDIIHSPQRFLAEAIYLHCAYPHLDLNVSALLMAIQSQLAQGRHVCLSEEMSLTDQPAGKRKSCVWAASSWMCPQLL